ncbi:MAG: replication protein P [Cellvibrionaceae bacterium]|nr:replication protein P [Cellvibrionaceae bacterium]
MTHDRNAAAQARRTALIDAINQVFTLFRLNYHNQYLKAFGNAAELNEVKRLWLEMLGQFDARTLLAAAKSVIETSEYLPTLRTMIYHCERASSDPGMPDAHSAYLEACRAPSPKAAHPWSHPAVYHAGKRCDWYFLQTTSEAVAFPVFRDIYEEVCLSVRNGVQLEEPAPPALPDKAAEPLDKARNQEKLQALRDSLKL